MSRQPVRHMPDRRLLKSGESPRARPIASPDGTGSPYGRAVERVHPAADHPICCLPDFLRHYLCGRGRGQRSGPVAWPIWWPLERPVHHRIRLLLCGYLQHSAQARLSSRAGLQFGSAAGAGAAALALRHRLRKQCAVCRSAPRRGVGHRKRREDQFKRPEAGDRRRLPALPLPCLSRCDRLGVWRGPGPAR